MHDYLALDMETYSATDLVKHGLDRYVNDPHFRPLIAVIMNPYGEHTEFDFVVNDYDTERERFITYLEKDVKIVAHNAGFEQAVLNRMGIHVPSSRFIDSAVIARMRGAAGKLEAAAPQLLDVDKMESGMALIRLFSIPQTEDQTAFDPAILNDHLTEWDEFMLYCKVDAQLSHWLYARHHYDVSDRELANNAVTMDMNNTGWRVDLDLVREMQTRYLANVDAAVQHFRDTCIEPDLNLNSHVQLKEWCAKRGIKATSFDEHHVERMLKGVVKRIETLPPGDKQANLMEVQLLLETKQIMGGASLKKLQTIIDTTGTDGRLHDQYLHFGAGATGRTTGRGVQMQNLKRLNGVGDPVELLFDPATQWDNSKMASNLRQVFTASHPDGFLIVGDFSSVESRGLAWQAGEQWKLDAYREGLDLYKVLAGKIFQKHHAQVTKPERQVGKVGELACGYQAGAGAVRDFAAKMGVELSEAEAAKLVRDWRAADPETEEYWRMLDELLHDALDMEDPYLRHTPNVIIEVRPFPAPASLREQTGNPGLKSLLIGMADKNEHELVSRVIHGVHLKGRNIHYWKPSERKTGDLWVDTWMNPKTKRQQPFTIYGGKLAGLFTQSLCRELFFDCLRKVHEWVNQCPNVRLVGQFHDEIVLDWVPDPNGPSLEQVKHMLTSSMTATHLKGFPLGAEIKSDYRYTK
jgi:DNA polymerase